MKDRIVITLLFYVLLNACSSGVKTIKVKTPKPAHTKEIFQVTKTNPNVKNGYYKKYKSKKLIELGFYKDDKKDSSWQIFNRNGSLIATGTYRSNKKVGVWTYYTKSKSLAQKYNHDTDSLIYLLQEVKQIADGPSNKNKTTYGEQLPVFIGGIDYMYTLLENNIEYPKKAWSELKEAKVIITFVVDTNGRTTEVTNVKPVGNGFDEAGKKMVESFGKAWIPATQGGKKVLVKFTLPVYFEIK